MTAFARTDRSPVGLWWWTMDRWSAVAVTVLIAIGAILSLAASPAIAEKIDQPSFYFVYKNLLFLIPSFFVAVCGVDAVALSYSPPGALPVLGARSP